MTPKEKKAALARIGQRRQEQMATLTEQRGVLDAAVEEVHKRERWLKDAKTDAEAAADEVRETQKTIAALDLEERRIKLLRPRLKRLLARIVSEGHVELSQPLFLCSGERSGPSEWDDGFELEKLGFVTIRATGGVWDRGRVAVATAAGKAKAKEGA
jgi:hypothetical protein